ncbi:hypothetical protein [Aureimonas ureilytica]|uniref:hypothetical protein n=1 Tax=Aureimonas ureilytica TaxID=401562 RepID=UPI000733DD91|nr:hypothetical protein [Aureimonas ureilytica]
MVERLNGRVQREVLGIMIYSRANMAIMMRDSTAANNGRRQRALQGPSPEMVLYRRLEADPALANPTDRPPSPNLIKRALRIVADAKDISHPDSLPLPSIIWSPAALKSGVDVRGAPSPDSVGTANIRLVAMKNRFRPITFEDSLLV